MSDLISREAAINTVQTMYERCDTGEITDYRDMMYESIIVLPSVQEQRWIPCAEKYPDADERVLVCINSYDYHVWDCMSNRGEDYFWEDEDGLFHNKYEVSLWMPLPEPWKGGK